MSSPTAPALVSQAGLPSTMQPTRAGNVESFREPVVSTGSSVAALSGNQAAASSSPVDMGIPHNPNVSQTCLGNDYAGNATSSGPTPDLDPNSCVSPEFDVVVGPGVVSCSNVHPMSAVGLDKTICMEVLVDA
ncbi:hypothetical protein V6N11_034023 [Hibiscus sabdariffa]|uniref:Uncharacterized protein n=1 Tax=Hibiscus sabdariffa TaxID=183260 RepID=A0ABR2S1M5_9ROSI